MKKPNEHLEFKWNETGNLDIDIFEEQNATLHYFPSQAFIDSTLKKFRSTACNQIKQKDNPISLHEEKVSQKPLHSIFESQLRRTKMSDTNTEFRELSIKSHNALKSGNLEQYATFLEQMAAILNVENKRIDELKLLMISFYVRLNHPEKKLPLNIFAMQQAKQVAEDKGLTAQQIKNLYFDTINENITPAHRITVNGSFRLFDICLRGLWGRAKIIISQLAE